MGKDLEIILYEGPVEKTGEGKQELEHSVLRGTCLLVTFLLCAERLKSP